MKSYGCAITFLQVALILAASALAWPSSWYFETPVEGANSGHKALDLDAIGQPHVFYFDATTDVLRYARKLSGRWKTEAVGSAAASVSGKLDLAGDPHISYRKGTALWYATKSDGAWLTEQIEGSAGVSASLVIDQDGNPHVCYDSFSGVVRHAWKAGAAWIAETIPGSMASGGLLSTSLAVDSLGSLHVCHWQTNPSLLVYSNKTSGVWASENVDATDGHVSIAVDTQNAPHIIYTGPSFVDLRYAHKSQGTWTVETMDAGGYYYTSIALDADAVPYVSYAGNDLRSGYRSGGNWTKQTVESESALYTSLALDADANVHIVYRGNGLLRYASSAAPLLMLWPAGGEVWPVGSLQTVSWSGEAPGSLYLSVDGGRTFEQLRDAIGNEFVLRVPHAPTKFGVLRIKATSLPGTADSDSFFTIDAVIALNKFEAATTPDRQIALSWETEPGPEAAIRYRIERSEGSAFAPLHEDVLTRTEYLDTKAAGAARYRLVAINGLGEEYVLGETTVAGRLAEGQDLIAYPNPTRSGQVSIQYRVPFDVRTGASDVVVDLAVYNAEGRRITTLEGGTYPTGVRSVAWDGHDDGGRAVSPGVYFLRLTSPGGFEASHRITVIR